jgi:hypothetical protein
MTIARPVRAACPVQLSSRDRRTILNNVLAALEKRFYRFIRLIWDSSMAVPAGLRAVLLPMKRPTATAGYSRCAFRRCRIDRRN